MAVTLKFELKRMINKTSIFVLILFLIFAVYIQQVGIDDYKEMKRKTEELIEIENLKVKRNQEKRQAREQR